MAARDAKLAGLGCGLLLVSALAVEAAAAQQAAPPAKAEGGALSGGRPKFGPPPGAALFAGRCAACHTKDGRDIGGRVAPSQSALAAMPAERVFDALVNGKMKAMAAGLTRVEQRQVAEYVTHRPIVDAAGTGVATMSGRCPAGAPFRVAGHAWNGWSPDPDNARAQTGAAAGLTAADVGKLKLKWAFGLPQGANSYSQPTVVGGRAFFAGDNGTLYAVDATSGCAYWSFSADSGVRSAPIVQPVKGYPRDGAAVFFASGAGTVFAVGAQTGTLLWKVHPGPEPSGITGSPAYHDGRLYVPFVGTETLAGADPRYGCCKSRGAVAALDADTGRTIWLASTIQQPLASRGRNEIGTELFGPAGASVWNSPTVDAKRRVLYVGTGNGYTEPAADTSDSIVALDLESGRIRWHYQLVADDAFVLGCPNESPKGRHCPAKLGPDWDIGGSSVILDHLPGGRDVLLAAGKAGVAIGVDPDTGKLLWRTRLYGATPPTADGLVVFGGTATGDAVYYPLQRPGGGLAALDARTGRPLWTVSMNGDGRGQVSAATSIPGAVFTGGWDGVYHAVGSDGRILWTFDTKRPFATVNGVPARGGSISSAGATVVDGMVYLTSGYIGMQQGTMGNVVLAFSAR